VELCRWHPDHPPEVAVRVAGFSIVRDATRLDFPFEAAVASVLPAVDEFVLVVGHSSDDTLTRARAINDPRLRLVESEWDFSLGSAVLAVETDRAMRAARAAWGIYIQADEVLADGGAAILRQAIDRHDRDARVAGLLVDYRHFYGGFDTVALDRHWYRREVRAVRLDPALGIHSFRDAQGFRAGPTDTRICAAASGAVMHHYGWARPEWALRSKREQDRAIYDTERAKDAERPLLPWFPGLRKFAGRHPEPVAEWIAARRSAEPLVEPPQWGRKAVMARAAFALERMSGWRPFEFRNYTLVR
jgi:hypothetical protein